LEPQHWTRPRSAATTIDDLRFNSLGHGKGLFGAVGAFGAVGFLLRLLVDCTCDSLAKICRVLIVGTSIGNRRCGLHSLVACVATRVTLGKMIEMLFEQLFVAIHDSGQVLE